MPSLVRPARCAVLIAVASVCALPAAASARTQPATGTGTVVSGVPLRPALWIPGTTARAFQLTYVTTDQLGRRATPGALPV